jgi:hypothetical protein
MANNNFDFGFTFEDTESVAHQPSTTDTEFQDALLQKISSLEKKISNSDVQLLVEEHKQLLTAEMKGKLHDIESMILPLLYNLQKNPDKEYIHWPNRTDIIQKQIDKILEVTRYYG